MSPKLCLLAFSDGQELEIPTTYLRSFPLLAGATGRRDVPKPLTKAHLLLALNKTGVLPFLTGKEAHELSVEAGLTLSFDGDTNLNREAPNLKPDESLCHSDLVRSEDSNI